MIERREGLQHSQVTGIKPIAIAVGHGGFIKVISGPEPPEDQKVVVTISFFGDQNQQVTFFLTIDEAETIALGLIDESDKAKKHRAKEPHLCGSPEFRAKENAEQKIPQAKLPKVSRSKIPRGKRS
jgi:hypothetical protein